MFQSSPGFGAGRYGIIIPHTKITLKVFQSSPGFGAGRYMSSDRQWGSYLEFQSSPGFGAGRYSLVPGISGMLKTVSILARLWSRALHHDQALQKWLETFQSSPGFGAGRYRLDR